MHLGLARSPAPGSVFVEREILFGVELKSAEGLVPCFVSAIRKVAMPEMEYPDRRAGDPTVHFVVQGGGPPQEMRRCPVVQAMGIDRYVITTRQGGQKRHVTAAKDVHIVETALLEEAAAKRPPETDGAWKQTAGGPGSASAHRPQVCGG